MKELIDMWPTRRDLADDCATAGQPITVERVHKWALADAIPAKYHLLVVEAALQRGFGVTAHDLAVLHATGARNRKDAA